jgi:hypothetical protein
MKTFILLTSILATTLCAQDVQTLLTEAQRDFMRGDRAAAKEKFAMIQKVEPTNRVALSYLRMIAIEEKKAGGDESVVLRARLEKTTLDKIEFRDATVGETIEQLGRKISAASPGSVKVNIVQQLSEQEKSKKITIALTNIAASEALRYVAELADLTVSYEKFAVVVKPKSQAAPVAAPKTDGGIRINGL